MCTHTHTLSFTDPYVISFDLKCKCSCRAELKLLKSITEAHIQNNLQYMITRMSLKPKKYGKLFLFQPYFTCNGFSAMQNIFHGIIVIYYFVFNSAASHTFLCKCVHHQQATVTSLKFVKFKGSFKFALHQPKNPQLNTKCCIICKLHQITVPQ